MTQKAEQYELNLILFGRKA